MFLLKDQRDKMIKEPIKNVLGLKALAWNYDTKEFISPARPEFTWSPGGLQACGCARDCKGEYPEWDCSCGLYASYLLDIINDYTDTSPISPIFLVEASGKTIIHELGWRSKEMMIHAVCNSQVFSGLSIDRPHFDAATAQAADYFQVPIFDMDTMLVMMDLFNTVKLEYYKPVSDAIKEMDRATVLSLCEQYMKTESQENK
jgi:hypothetical protein